MPSERDLYFVAVKAFLIQKGKIFIFKDRHGEWDLPGGRIQKHEFSTPLEQVLRRKLKEELGSAIKYSIGKPRVFMRHERIEASTGKRVRIFAIGYDVALKSGAPRLSGEHTKSLWVPMKGFKPARYFKGGWLKGAQEYLRTKA